MVNQSVPPCRHVEGIHRPHYCVRLRFNSVRTEIWVDRECALVLHEPPPHKYFLMRLIGQKADPALILAVAKSDRRLCHMNLIGQSCTDRCRRLKHEPLEVGA